MHEKIKFTVDYAVDGKLPFLDVELEFLNDQFTTKVYRKPTFTARLINFKSVCPKSWKNALISNLILRAYRNSSTWLLFHEECEYIRTMLTFNNYPHWWFFKHVKRFLSDHFKQQTSPKILLDGYFIKLPYVGEPSDAAKLCKNFNIKNVKVAFCITKLRTLFPLKQKNIPLLKSKVNYCFTCSRDASITYIGETCRHLITRINDHKKQNQSAIGNHISECNMCQRSQLTNNFTILKSSQTKYENMIKEALLIKQYKPILNKQMHQGKCYTLRVF
jgi:hypothetical protein